MAASFLTKWQNAVTSSQAPLSKTERLVALTLSLYMNENGACWPSVKTIADRAKLTERTVQHALRGLESAGYVKTFFRHRATSRYQATFPTKQKESIYVEVPRIKAEELGDWTACEIRFVQGLPWKLKLRKQAPPS